MFVKFFLWENRSPVVIDYAHADFYGSNRYTNNTGELSELISDPRRIRLRPSDFAVNYNAYTDSDYEQKHLVHPKRFPHCFARRPLNKI